MKKIDEANTTKKMFYVVAAILVLAIGVVGFKAYNTESVTSSEVITKLVSNPTLLSHLEGPQGPEGPEGPIGPQGPQGPMGVAGEDGKDADSDQIVALTKKLEELNLVVTQLKTAPPVVQTNVEPQAPRTTEINTEILDSSDNWEGHGNQKIADTASGIAATIKEWRNVDGWSFPLGLNRHGLPSPLKGGGPPMFLKHGSTVSDWQVRAITLKNPHGSGQYVSQGWAYRKSGG